MSTGKEIQTVLKRIEVAAEKRAEWDARHAIAKAELHVALAKAKDVEEPEMMSHVEAADLLGWTRRRMADQCRAGKNRRCTPPN